MEEVGVLPASQGKNNWRTKDSGDDNNSTETRRFTVNITKLLRPVSGSHLRTRAGGAAAAWTSIRS